MQEYLKCLIEQFKLAKGIKTVDINSSAFLSEFNGWLNERKSMINDYLELLDDMNVDFDNPKCVEINKGKYDSSVLHNYSTTIITPYMDSNNKRIINGRVEAIDSRPAIIRNINGGIYVKSISRDLLQSYMIFNPYEMEALSYWDDIHNSNEANIIVGMFGNLSDKDFKFKVSSLRRLKDRLLSPYKFEETIIDGNYFSVVSSGGKVKNKFLVK